MKKHDIHFLYEIGTLRFINRTWRQFLTSDFANVSEHIFRVAWIALMIANNEPQADTGKVVKIALVHDLSESRTGDVNYVSKLYATSDDTAAMNDMLTGTSLEAEARSLWEEYEKRDTLESKIVKDADNLDVDFELMEQKARGSTLPDKWLSFRKKGVRDRLFTETAKEIWDSLHETDPDAWHTEAPNRNTAGDLK